ncbi:biosynthetic-type acetolactate synthase large subunit [Sedimentibacter hydroxybenzoicus DSM 7310]|uniref:Acetolactate synthase n=1 Tax=Sedimentibacter hydroxybenzoicus DSM 7310 TaxID=1123245 RepID=A0A974BKW6_SEDHY|nr:biosynthetic-type acetolactate synthase large subunit [Sedimentibacter hydroxybenzoicus]NYB74627.1 biosynthetic-type acetolactate synthase large subunit [Sedimentibacter hydroxybenzoicus DSM 7310]
MKLTGSQIILRVLREKGIDTLFGYPGGAVIPFFDALHDELDYFKVYRPAHEQNGVHAADGYARSTGKLGVFVATSGPGATNTITGIANAYMDSVPLLVITGQVANVLIGKDSFQEVDITGMTLSVTKHSYMVRKIEDLENAMREAIEVSLEGRPGPVVVDVPKDVFLDTWEYEGDLENTHTENKLPEKDDLDLAVKLINEAKRPVIYAGGGVRISENDDVLLQFAEKTQIPVCNSFMGLGTIPRSNKLSLGFVGMHGFVETNMAVTNCDLLIAIGARFSDRVIGRPDRFAPRAKIIHIDVDSTEVNKNTYECLPLIGDMETILNTLLKDSEPKDRKNWLDEIHSKRNTDNIEGEFVPENILKEVNKYFNDDTVVATDVGQHQMWTGQFWNFNKSNEFITSGGLGTMGFGMGAAIGAQVGNPNKKVILVTGDGSFRMNNQELVTISRYKLPVKILMLNNNSLGMVRQWQRMFSNARYSETDNYEDVDYLMLTRAYGIISYKAESMDELTEILNEVSNVNEPVFIECKIDSNCSVYPIVPPGRPIDELLLNG